MDWDGFGASAIRDPVVLGDIGLISYECRLDAVKSDMILHAAIHEF